MSKSKGSTNLDRLTELKFQKLKHQSSLSKKMNDILTKSGGMNDSTHHSIKSINAAIAVAKQPGYFDYYAASDDIKHAEEKKTLNHLAKEIQKVHLELEQLNGEIHTAELQNQPKQPDAPAVSNLSQWFEQYGRPNMTDEKRNLLTNFEKNEKRYGGTHHYESFPTVSTMMVKGKITR